MSGEDAAKGRAAVPLTQSLGDKVKAALASREDLAPVRQTYGKERVQERKQRTQARIAAEAKYMEENK